MIKLLFEELLFVLDLGSIPYKDKKKLREKITDNGGVISYIITKTSDYVIVPIDKGDKVDTYKSRKAQALKIPVLSASFLDACLEAGRIVDVDLYRVVGLTRSGQFKDGKIEVEGWNVLPKSQFNPRKLKTFPSKTVKQYVTGSGDCPKFSKHFHVGKFIVLERCNADAVHVTVLELHIAAYEDSSVDALGLDEYRIRILEQSCVFPQGTESSQHILSHEYFLESCEDALMKMQYMADEKKLQHKMMVVNQMHGVKMGSHKLRHMLEEMGASSGILPAPVARLVSSIATLAFGELSQSLTVGISAVTPDQITKATVLLMKMKQRLKEGKSTSQLSLEFNSAISLKSSWGMVSDMKALSQRQDFVQLLKDIMLVHEIAPGIDSIIKSKFDPQCLLALYKMLKCSITVLSPEEEDHEAVSRLLCVPGSNILPPRMEIRNIFRVHRDIEDNQFAHSLSPTKLLFHASNPQNLVGILSRGLLLPLVVVSEHGTERTDIGMLGSAIYFADDIRKAIRYSEPNRVSGSRYVLVNEVALGRCQDYTEFTPSLTHPPKGFDSVRGVASEEASDFDFNEYAIFNVEQQRIRYLVEFTLKEDVFIRFDDIPQIPITDIKTRDGNTGVKSSENEKISLDDIKKLKNLPDQVKPGLLVQTEGRDQQVPLEEVHIRAKMMDMVAEVVVMQVYSNNSKSALEAKYVFPLDDAVAVCGFEAFINGKHVIGKVKEKEVAHKEYKAAIDAGHGAYLMDQEKPDIFTVSVGNLPPRAKVLIKITYVVELPVIPADDGSSDSILFFLPGSVAAASRREALISGPVTQTKVGRVTASSTKLRDSSVVISIEMPFPIRTIESPTHRIFVKRTSTKACVRLSKKDRICDVGFKLLVSLAEIHVPRMWVEQHPEEEESQACMLAFYPEFEVKPVRDYKAIILLDMSQSMKGNLEQDVKKLALMLLEKLPSDCFINVVKFGSGYEELFIMEQHFGNNKVAMEVEEFIQSCSASSGSSEAWRPLTSLDALRKSSDSQSLTNVFMMSDGHLSEEHRLLQLARSLGESGKKNITRIFTFSVGNSSNQHLLRSIAYTSGATHEHFSADFKSKWEAKVENQLKKAGQPMLKDIRVEWKRYNDDDMFANDQEVGLPVQAPEKIKCLFNSCRLVVYGFIPHCTQAELFATVCGKEISTVVSTSQLSITEGKTLHRLAARAMIRDYEEGLPDLNPLLRDKLKASRKPHVITLSCLHDIVSPYTSFVAVEERQKDEDLASGDGPPVVELVNSVFHDPIPEIQWDQEALWEEMPGLERVKKGIENAKRSYHSSVAECNRYIEEVESIIPTLSNVQLKEAQLKLLALKMDLQMEVEYPVINLALGEYLLKVVREPNALEDFPFSLLETDPKKWRPPMITSGSFRKCCEKLNEVKMTQSGNDDPRRAAIVEWWNKLDPSSSYVSWNPVDFQPCIDSEWRSSSPFTLQGGRKPFCLDLCKVPFRYSAQTATPSKFEGRIAADGYSNSNHPVFAQQSGPFSAMHTMNAFSNIPSRSSDGSLLSGITPCSEDGFEAPSLASNAGVPFAPLSGFSFRASSMSAPNAEAPPAPPSGLVFGASSAGAQAPPAAPSGFGFGASSVTSTSAWSPPAPPFGFGFGASSASARGPPAPPSGFDFGALCASARASALPSELCFGASSISASTAGVPFATTSGFGFGASSMSASNAATPPAPPFRYMSDTSVMASSQQSASIFGSPPKQSSNQIFQEEFNCSLWTQRTAVLREDDDVPIAVPAGGIRSMKKRSGKSGKESGKAVHDFPCYLSNQINVDAENDVPTENDFLSVQLSAKSPVYSPTSPGHVNSVHKLRRRSFDDDVHASVKKRLDDDDEFWCASSYESRSRSSESDEHSTGIDRSSSKSLKSFSFNGSDTSSSSGSDASSSSGSASSSLVAGLGSVFSLFGSDCFELLYKLGQGYAPDIKLKSRFVPALFEAAKGYDLMTQLLSCFEEVVQSSGAVSLGQQGYETACMMIGVACVIAFCKVLGNPPKACVDWLKKMDEEYPMLYSRLDFGSSWSEAATNIFNMVAVLCNEKSLSLESLKAEICSYCESLDYNRQ